MSKQRRRDTAAEQAIRQELWRRGLRYRVEHAVIGRRQRADIAFTRARVAVFVDGCFWHCCPIHATYPRSNAEWWRDKLNANVRRDRATDAALVSAGWLVVRVWEHDDPRTSADVIERLVRGGTLT